MARVLVTGATGFIGANVVRSLLERGHRVRVLVRPTSDRGNIDGLPLEICMGDLQDRASVEAAVHGCEQVFHIAAEYNFWSLDPAVMYRSNIEGTRNVMDAALKEGATKVVYTSTVGAIGLQGQPEPCNESTPMESGQLTSHYKRSKYEAEKLALSYVARGLPLVVVNPSAPIGPWDRKPTPTGKIIVDFITGKIPAYLDTGLNLVHVRDVAEGHVLAAEKGRVGERYILGNRNLSLGEILEMLSGLTGRPKPRVQIPYGVAWLAGLASTKMSDWVTKRPPAIAFESVKMARRHMYFDASKAIRELGLPQTPVDRALSDSIDWYSQHGYFKHQKITEGNLRNGYPTETGNERRQVHHGAKAQGQ